MKRTAFAALLALLPTAGLAQTAEEAVAYTFLGLADGAHIERGSTSMKWKESGSSPTTFHGDAVTGGNSYQIDFIVKAIDDCRYEITLEGPPRMVRGGSALFAKVDLSDIRSVTVEDKAIMTAIAGNGFCETGATNPTCMVIDKAELFGFVDVEKHKAAAAYLATVCPAKEG